MNVLVSISMEPTVPSFEALFSGLKIKKKQKKKRSLLGWKVPGPRFEDEASKI